MSDLVVIPRLLGLCDGTRIITIKVQRFYRGWENTKIILKRTKEMFLVYGGEEELVVRGYVDANFQTDRDDCRS